MGARSREEDAPLGVMQCLAAGFEVLNRRLGLVTLPVLLDLFLWLGPRLSVELLMNRLLPWLQASPGADAATVQGVIVLRDLLQRFGQEFNLLSLLSGLPLLGVPSLMAREAPQILPGGNCPVHR